MANIERIFDYEPFNQIPKDAVTRLESAAGHIVYPAETVIFKQSDMPTGFLYYIQNGEVEIIAETNEGVEMIVDYRQSGGFFGWTPIFTQEGYTAGARTATETSCLLIPQRLLQDISKEYPIISKYFNKAIFSQIRKLYKNMVSKHSTDPLAQMEAYPFQKRLYEIMSKPVLTCSPDTTIREVAFKMTETDVSALVVCDENGKMQGIITEKDLVRKVLAKDIDVCQKHSTAAHVMTTEPHSMPSDTYMYQAATFMLRHNIRHLPVVDGDSIEGIVTQKDLMKFRSQKSMLLVGSAHEAKSIAELKEIRSEIVTVAKVLLIENRSHVETMEILSYIHHSIIARCYELIDTNMQKKGFKKPDVKFCFMIMGSGGRKEMLLGPDQDNGFLFENFDESMRADVEGYFYPLADELVDALADIGYPLCHGKVMVNNPLWRGTLNEWDARVCKWIEVPEPQKVRYSSIFFDFMPIVGDPSLCDGLRDIVNKYIKSNPLFLYQMMELDFKHKVPIGLLGRFVTHSGKEHKGELSLKENGSIFIVDCVRMFMLEQSIHAITTIDRLDKLEELSVFNKATVEHVKAAFESFTYLRLQNEIKLIEDGEKPSHFLNPDELTDEEAQLLKEAFKVASKLQDSTRKHFSKIIGR
ncbi:MAG: putative nucleotidyltransferase substrate binding domain-containing protein [Deferribacterales bacterium]|jgi:CBS domain-containing protein